MKRLRYIGVAVLIAGPLIVQTNQAAHAAGQRLISAGSVTLSGLAGSSGGLGGVQNPEIHAPKGDEGGGPEPSPGAAPSVKGSKVATAGPEMTLTFAGLNHRDNRLADGGNQFSSEPPDQALCVGPSQVLEGVNTVLRVYDKTGNIIKDTVTYNEFFGYPAAIDRTTGEFGAFLTDPVCHYDPGSGRFFMVVLTLDQDPISGDFTGANRLDIAVSETSDATGVWHLYKLPVQNDGTEGTPDHGCDPDKAPFADETHPAACLGDYPHIGSDAYGVYLTTNEYSLFGDGTNGGAAYTGAQIYALSKSQLVNGDASPTVVSFESPKLGPFRSFTVWPAISPAGQEETSNGGTEFFLSSTLGDGSETLNPAPSEDRIGVWALTNTSSLDSDTPHLRLSKKLVKADTYTMPPHATQKAGPTPLRDCLNDTSTDFAGFGCWFLFVDPPAPPHSDLATLDALDGRMQQVVYSGGHLYGAMSTGVQVGGSIRAGVLWVNVEPEVDNGKLKKGKVDASGYVAIRNNDIIFPALGVSASGKVVMAATVSGDDHYPSASYTVLTEERPTVKIISEGKGPQDGFSAYPAFGSPRSRWGDYGAVAMDGETLWLASESIEQSCTLDEYLDLANFPDTVGSCGGTRTALANWGTRVTALNFQGHDGGDDHGGSGPH
ncbi:MAG: hypothetical protein QOE09_1391 [Ilumatobacteraceae bacterium]|jgi:hypothetical protein